MPPKCEPRPTGHSREVEFIGLSGRSVTAPLPNGENAEIAIKRSVFDQILLRRARSLGAEVREGETLLSARAQAGIGRSRRRSIAKRRARILVAADGRNSTVARLCNLMPRKGRIAWRCKRICRCRDDFGDRIVLQLLPRRLFRSGAGRRRCAQPLPGQSARTICSAVKRWAEREFAISDRSLLADDRAAGARSAAREPARSLFGRRRGASGRAVYRRRNLLRPCDPASWRRQAIVRARDHQQYASRAPRTLRRPPLDQSARARTRSLHPRLTTGLLAVSCLTRQRDACVC